MKILITTYFFESSKKDKYYQTLEFSDKTYSCDCPGWTFKRGGADNRECKHVRYVKAGLAGQIAAKTLRHKIPESGQSLLDQSKRTRVFDLEE